MIAKEIELLSYIRYNLNGDFMKSINKTIINEIIINKSRFICEIIPLNNINDIDDILKKIKDKYKAATHYCYAYKINNIKRFNDDGEPGGTAGMPILNVLDNNDLNNIICIVIRYFGGIKLGAGGLVRAYTKAVTSLLENTTLEDLDKGFEIEISFSYDKNKYIDYLLKNYNIIDKQFNKNIIYTFSIKEKDFNNIEEVLKSNVLNIEIKKEIFC